MKIEHAYAAGLYEGEGSVTVYKGCARVSIGMKDLEPLNRMLAIYGGKIYGPYTGAMYSWRLSGWAAVEAFYASVRATLSERRCAQFTKVLAAARAQPRQAVTRPAPCGFDRNLASTAGHVRHHRRGEKACIDCYHAAKLYMQQWRANHAR